MPSPAAGGAALLGRKWANPGRPSTLSEWGGKWACSTHGEGKIVRVQLSEVYSREGGMEGDLLILNKLPNHVYNVVHVYTCSHILSVLY